MPEKLVGQLAVMIREGNVGPSRALRQTEEAMVVFREVGPALLAMRSGDRDERRLTRWLDAADTGIVRQVLARVAALEANGVVYAMTPNAESFLESHEGWLGELAEDIAADKETPEVREALARHETDGWALRAAVQRMRAGERVITKLASDVDLNSAALIEALVQMVRKRERAH
eukprot:TRINITY_DN7628_c0_g1_i3.p1 TRINITY_DN7628_c0_g1~~TRINITY_DN7628_c0_g1_i3.p1  ORF type:complete len:174 (+),score=31.98 TRINITY_DN7628_c0_g1_i3:128-649(+)